MPLRLIASLPPLEITDVLTIATSVCCRTGDVPFGRETGDVPFGPETRRKIPPMTAADKVAAAPMSAALMIGLGPSGALGSRLAGVSLTVPDRGGSAGCAPRGSELVTA